MEARIASGKRADTARGLRAGLRATRLAMSPSQRLSADTQIAARLQPWIVSWIARRERLGHREHRVAGFWPMDTEPDLRGALAALADPGKVRLALPVVERRGAPLIFREWFAGAPMAAGDFGIPEPTGTALLVPDLILVPLLGFTDQADRIGYGGGFYDRTLASLRDTGQLPCTIGIAYACCRLAPGTHVPEPHDYRLNAIVHEDGWTPSEP